MNNSPLGKLALTIAGVRRRFQHLLTAICATWLWTTLLPAHAASIDPPKAPNIVIIYADDLGYGDVKCNNPEGKIATPNVDRLASEGMRFTDGHSSSGVCSPSRYTILTGRYHWRSRLQTGIVQLYERPLIAPDRLTFADIAKQHGYRTAAIGKWHLGWNWPKNKGKVDFSQPIKDGPISCGFDSYFGTDVPNWPPYCFIENDRTVGVPSQRLPKELVGNNLASKPGPALPDWQLEGILPALGDRAVAFIKEAAKQPEPFLLYMPLTSPHTPLAVNEEWKGKSGLGPYADLVMETDAVVGRVLAAIKESGVEENTLVLFTSDNGCAPYIGVAEMEKQGHRSSGPLRGYKSDVLEGGHRVPFIVRWPSVVKPGSVSDQLVHQADVIATVADVLKTTLPDDVGEDSFSLLPILQGSGLPVRDTAVSCSIQGVPALRQGEWKYIAGQGAGGWSKGGNASKPVQLYNLAEDLGEQKNLAAEQPERVKEMQKMLEQLITAGRSTKGAPQKNDVEVRRFPAKK